MSESYSTGMASANHIQAAASWLATAAETDEGVAAAQPQKFPHSLFIYRILSL